MVAGGGAVVHKGEKRRGKETFCGQLFLPGWLHREVQILAGVEGVGPDLYHDDAVPPDMLLLTPAVGKIKLVPNSANTQNIQSRP